MDDTSTDTFAETFAETPALPPCRQAELFITSCAICGRKMRLKTLRYSHVCSRSFHPMQRALEQQVAANNAINARMASIEPLERGMQHTATHTQKNTEKQKNSLSKIMNKKKLKKIKDFLK